jgi:sulfur carrier protein
MRIFLNGEQRDLAPGTSLGVLVGTLNLDGRRIAVEVNEEIVPRSRYTIHRLREGDRVEIVKAMGGG